MSFVMDQFVPWVGEALTLYTPSYVPPTPSGKCVAASSPRVALERHGSDVRFETRAPWWQNPSPGGPARSVWGLWEYEVLEIFIVGQGGRYLELEIGPWGHHLMLALSAPREIERRHLTPAQLRCERHSAPLSDDVPHLAWSSEGLIHGEQLPVPYRDQEMVPYWRVNSFWCFSRDQQRYHCSASPLPGERPDFHQPQHFPQWILS